jgi:hypothetical protein
MTHIANCMRRGVDRLMSVYFIKDSTSSASNMVSFLTYNLFLPLLFTFLY